MWTGFVISGLLVFHEWCFKTKATVNGIERRRMRYCGVGRKEHDKYVKEEGREERLMCDSFAKSARNNSSIILADNETWQSDRKSYDLSIGAFLMTLNDS